MRLVICSVALCMLAGRALADPRLGDPAPTDPPAATGKPTVVDFFATWCGPCQLAMAALDGILRSAGGQIDLVVVDVGEDPAQVKAFLAAHPLPASARVVFDRTGELARRWGQHRFPTTFILDGAGVIRHINRGYGPGYAERMRGWLRSYIKPIQQ